MTNKHNSPHSVLAIDEQLVLLLNDVSSRASQSTLNIYTKYLSGHVSDLFLRHRLRPDEPTLENVELAISKAREQTRHMATRHIVYPYCNVCKFGIFNQEDLLCKSCWLER